MRLTLIVAGLAALISAGCDPAHAATPKAGTVSIGDVSCAEDSLKCTFPLTKTQATQATKIRIQTYDITAKAPANYVARLYETTLSGNTRSTSFTVTYRNDTVFNGPLQFGARVTILSNGILSKATGIASVIDDEAAPAPVVCADGSTLPPGSTCPPPSTPGCTNTVSVIGEGTLDVLGVCNVPSNFNVASKIATGFPLPQDDGDPVGAFRFECSAGQLLYDDPIVYPGQPGKSHLHQFYGNTGANANSTYESLRTTGDSTCGSPLNRSAYWMPAMLDGHGSVVRPDRVGIYYKRLPTTDPNCHRLSQNRPTAAGECRPLVNGLKIISGYNFATGKQPSETDPGIVPTTAWHCYRRTTPGNVEEINPKANGEMYATLAELVPYCPTTLNADGRPNVINMVSRTPDCWDGVHLDSADHRSHMAFSTYSGSPDGTPKCDSAHPFLVPVFQLSTMWTVDGNLKDWLLASDAMVPGAPAGRTMHFDWDGAWDNSVLATWTDNCINKGLSCSGGELGNGSRMINENPIDVVSGLTAQPRLVPVPPMTM